MKIRLLILLVTVQCVFAETAEKKTEIFSKYLQTNHNLNITQEKHYYLIVNAVACETCKKVDFEFLSELSNRDDFTIIISFSQRKKLPKEVIQITKKSNVYLDKGEYYDWNITPLTDGLIITENNRIQKIHNLEYWNKKTILDFVKEE